MQGVNRSSLSLTARSWSGAAAVTETRGKVGGRGLTRRWVGGAAPCLAPRWVPGLGLPSQSCCLRSCAPGGFILPHGAAVVPGAELAGRQGLKGVSACAVGKGKISYISLAYNFMG